MPDTLLEKPSAGTLKFSVPDTLLEKPSAGTLKSKDWKAK
jgi:hypothetical protein